MSQAGQDYWVYGEVFNEQRDGYFLDVGAHDGRFLSNTYLLEKRYGWKGICIEGNPLTFPALLENRTCTCVNRCVDARPGIVTFALDGVMGGIVSSDCDNSNAGINVQQIEAATLEEILKNSDAPSIIDYMSIDIEGAEDRALLNFPWEKFSFKCITIERPSKDLNKLLEEKEYVLVKKIEGLDSFYVHESFYTCYAKNILEFGRKKFKVKRWM